MINQKISFYNVCSGLEKFWKGLGCNIFPGYNMEMGAGTFHPWTVFGCLLYNEWKFASLQPCVRPADSMAGMSPNRFHKFHQYQVIIKPSQIDVKDIFLKSLEVIGFDLSVHQIDFIESEWKSPSLGAYGVGWEIRCDGMEICQITYFNRLAGMDFSVPVLEFAYGVERLVIKLNGLSHGYEGMFTENLRMEIFKKNEQDFYQAENMNFYEKKDFDRHKDFYNQLMEKKLFYSSYDQILKATHVFNCLDVFLSISDRREYILQLNKMYKDCCGGLLEMVKVV